MDPSSWFRRAFSRRKPESSPGHGSTTDTALLREFGVSEELREFVKGFTLDTFKNFEDHEQTNHMANGESPNSADNVRRDLTEWQERHATLVLSTVKEISQLRYVLCPRHLKERQFWRIYFTLVKSYVAPYEMHAKQQAKLKMMQMEDENSIDASACEVEMTEAKQLTNVPLASLEHDPDTFF